ncbi:MAG: SAM-dependent methyltransferase [Acidobacteriota bacterium]
MSLESSVSGVLRNRLKSGDLPFGEFVELVLYHPQLGYYARGQNPVGKEADYVTAPLLSPVFSFALGNLIQEFLRRHEGELCSIVDIGCGDGSLICDLASRGEGQTTRFIGVDRALARVNRGSSEKGRPVEFVSSLEGVPRGGCHLIVSNELYDAFPFSRLVRRGDRIHELYVTERGGALDWSEQRAPEAYEDYFAERGVALDEGQFADVSLAWETFHEEVLRLVKRGLIVTIDYGFPAEKLFHPRARRFGTAAAYAGQRVSRDLLASPGQQDLTAHINFTDLERAGAREGARTLFFDRLARFLLTLDITSHELFRPVHEVEIASAQEGVDLLQAREDARRLVLPDGIGEEMRVLVQSKGAEMEGWSFQRALF